MKTLNHLGNTVDKVDPETVMAWRTHWATAGWMTTQTWSWDGGDALVGIVGDIFNAKAYVAIRIDRTIHVVQAEGLTSAMAAFGLNPSEYVIGVAS